MTLGDEPQDGSATDDMDIDAIIRKFMSSGDDPQDRSTTDDDIILMQSSGNS